MYAFNASFEEIRSNGAELKFRTSWKNGTGYLDGIVKDQIADLEIGGQAVFIDDYGRRAIVTRTRFGNVVVFERYTPKPERAIVVVQNAPTEVGYLLGPVMSRSLTEDAVAGVVGYAGLANIGLRIETLLATAAGV